MPIVHYFRRPGVVDDASVATLARAQKSVLPSLTGLKTEFCFNVDLTQALNEDAERKLVWLLCETFESHLFGKQSLLTASTADESKSENVAIVEVGYPHSVIVKCTFDLMCRWLNLQPVEPDLTLNFSTILSLTLHLIQI